MFVTGPALQFNDDDDCGRGLIFFEEPPCSSVLIYLTHISTPLRNNTPVVSLESLTAAAWTFVEAIQRARAAIFRRRQQPLAHGVLHEGNMTEHILIGHLNTKGSLRSDPTHRGRNVHAARVSETACVNVHRYESAWHTNIRFHCLVGWDNSTFTTIIFILIFRWLADCHCSVFSWFVCSFSLCFYDNNNNNYYYFCFGPWAQSRGH